MSRGTIANYTPAKLRKVINDATSVGNTDLTINDDKKIIFGNDADALIEYNENGDDYLIISGSSKGIVLSGSTIQIAGTLEGASPLKIGGELQFTSTGSAGAFNFGPNQEARIYYSGEVANDGINASDMLVISGTTNGGIVLSGSHTIVDSSLTIRGNIYSHGDVTVNAQDSVSLDPANNVILNPGTKTISHKNIHLLDNKRLYFGTDNDAYIEYDEANSDEMIINGGNSSVSIDSMNDVVLKPFDDIKLNPSGKTIVLGSSNDFLFEIQQQTNSGEFLKCVSPDGNPAIELRQGGGGNGGIHLYDDSGNSRIYIEAETNPKIMLKNSSAGTEGIIQHTADDFLTISGSSSGLAFSGSNIHLHGQTIISGSTSGFLLELQQQVDSGEFLKCVSPDGNRSIELRQGNGGNGLLYLADDDGNATLLLDPSYIKFRDTNNSDKGKISYTADNFFTISGSSSGIVLSGSETLIRSDNVELGADTGASLVELKFKGNGTDGALQWYPAGDRFVFNDEVRIVDDKKISFGNSADGNIKFSNSSNELQIESAEIKFSGSVFYFGDNNTDNHVDIRFLGSSNDGRLLWDPTGDKFIFLDSVRLQDDKKLYFGTGDESYIEYNEDGDNYLTIAGSSNGIALSGSAVHVPGTLAVASNIEHIEDSNTKISFSDDSISFMAGGHNFITISENDVQDKIQLNPGIGDVDFILYHQGQYPSLMVSGSDGIIHSNYGIVVHDNKKLYFGSDSDASITYDEAGDDLLVISGSSQGLKLAGSKIVFDSDSIMSGTIAGPASYLGINSNGQLVLTASSGGSGGEALQLAAGNNISLDTDENGLVTISYLPAHASDPIPDDGSEAASIVTGGALYWRAGSGYRMSLHNTGYLGVGITGSANVTHRITLPDIDGPGGQVRANGFVSYSTRRLKKDIEPLQNSLEVIKNLQGVSYKWKSSNREDYGFIAEDVGKVLPGIVQWEENGKDAMSMDYNKIISFLVEAVKEQQTQIEKLNQRLVPDDTE